MAADLRRTPQQERSRRSVDAILDATAELLTDTDPTALTMSAIGDRAGVSKAAIYRYYPDRPAVIRALAQRYLESIDELFVATLDPEKVDVSTVAPLGSLIDAYYQAFLDDPVLRAIWITGFNYPEVGEFCIDFDKRLAARVIEGVGGAINGTPEERERRVLLLVHVLRSAVELAVHEGAEEGSAIIAELKRVFLTSGGLAGD